MSAPAELAAGVTGPTPDAPAAPNDPVLEHARDLTGRPTLTRDQARSRYAAIPVLVARIKNQSAVARELGLSEARVRQLLKLAQSALLSEGAPTS